MSKNNDQKSMICTACYQENKWKQKTPGSFVLELFLWILFFPVGIIYSIWRLSTRKWICECGNEDFVPANSPRGEIIKAQLAK